MIVALAALCVVALFFGMPLFIGLGAAGPAARATRVYSAIDAGVLSMDAYRFD